MFSVQLEWKSLFEGVLRVIGGGHMTWQLLIIYTLMTSCNIAQIVLMCCTYNFWLSTFHTSAQSFSVNFKFIFVEITKKNTILSCYQTCAILLLTGRDINWTVQWRILHYEASISTMTLLACLGGSCDSRMILSTNVFTRDSHKSYELTRVLKTKTNLDVSLRKIALQLTAHSNTNLVLCMYIIFKY